VLTRDGNGNAFRKDGHRPDEAGPIRKRNRRPEGRKPEAGTKPERGKREGGPSFLSSLLPFPLSSLSFLSRSRTRERKQNSVTVHPLFFAVHPDFISVRRKQAFF